MSVDAALAIPALCKILARSSAVDVPLVFSCGLNESGHALLDYAAYWREDRDNPALKRFFTLLDEHYPAPEAF